MQGEGMTFKLTPLEFGGNGGINTSKMVDLMMDGYALKIPGDSTRKVNFLWGNMHEEGVLVDYYTMRMVQNIRLQIMKLTDALIKENKKDEAVAILDKTFEIMPIEITKSQQMIFVFICVQITSTLVIQQKVIHLGKSWRN